MHFALGTLIRQNASCFNNLELSLKLEQKLKYENLEGVTTVCQNLKSERDKAVLLQEEEL